MSRRSLRARRQRSAGYTMVEVMMALALLGLGATGIAAIQKTVILGDTNARNLATANAIAAGWADRLQTDAAQWTITAGVSSTAWLGAGFGTWIVPETTGFVRGASDIVGADLSTTAPPAQGYCTQIRLTGLPAAAPTLIRAEIRVLYQRQSAPISCEALTEANINAGVYGAVYLTTGILPSAS